MGGVQWGAPAEPRPLPAQVLRSLCPADHGAGDACPPQAPASAARLPGSRRAAVAGSMAVAQGAPALLAQPARAHRTQDTGRGEHSFHWALSSECTRAVPLVPKHLMMLLLILLLFLNVVFSQLKYSSSSTDTRPERSIPESRTDPCRTPKRSFSAAETAPPRLALYCFSF